MSRILLLALFLVWMAGPPEASPHDAWSSLALFFIFYLSLVLFLGMWSRILVRRIARPGFHRSIRTFNKVMFAARILVPVWFTIGVWGLGWGALIKHLGDGVYRSVAGMLLGTMPAFATWMGLWWSQYPADRALREQNLLADLDNDLPIYQPPEFRSYFFSNFRLQILFTLAPVALIVLLRDVLMWTASRMTGHPFSSDAGALEAGCSFASAAIVYLFAPALLVRVLNTSPMPDSPLRRRLDAHCQRAGIGYRNILVWNTSNHLGNAAVMGVLPKLRYILLSDVLLERMSDEEIEAVFAHELGHIVHRHMTWYAVYFVTAMLWTVVAANVLPRMLAPFTDAPVAAVMSPAGLIVLLLMFGVLSRRCERQADVFAARMMQRVHAERVPAILTPALAPMAATAAAPAIAIALANDNVSSMPVGEYGARLFAIALQRVAIINNIPISPRAEAGPGVFNRVAFYADHLFELFNNFMHGSILSRMTYVRALAADPRRTAHFDAAMLWLYCTLLAALFFAGAFTLFLSVGAHGVQFL